jgi:hypothetical protein
MDWTRVCTHSLDSYTLVSLEDLCPDTLGFSPPSDSKYILIVHIYRHTIEAINDWCSYVMKWLINSDH